MSHIALLAFAFFQFFWEIGVANELDKGWPLQHAFFVTYSPKSRVLECIELCRAAAPHCLRLQLKLPTSIMTPDDILAYLEETKDADTYTRFFEELDTLREGSRLQGFDLQLIVFPTLKGARLFPLYSKHKDVPYNPPTQMSAKY